MRTPLADTLDDSYSAGNMSRLFELALSPELDTHPLDLEEIEGDQVGPYRLLSKLGEGGFSIVWLAEQEKPVRRQVAVKILRLGMDSVAVLRRFRAEQRALERMEHPNIAAVLDAGMTENGRPYIVLELVRGSPITKFCQAASLPLNERLALFLDVCRAVQHAHQRAVLHRDLKPSNILIADGESPSPKVIDFGIAKALTDGDAFTDTESGSMLRTLHGVLLGTPHYMAPEQAAYGSHVADIRADVYALGAILYELLVGTTPFDVPGQSATALGALLKRIHEEDPVRPSLRALQRRVQGLPIPCSPELLKGDLDWIILKALEKEPDRRYESPNALAQDIQHYLVDKPIIACPPALFYRFSKWVRRNRLAFIVTATIGINVIMLTAFSVRGFLREVEARTHAEALRLAAENSAAQADAESEKAKALAEFLSNLLEKAGALVDEGKNPEALRAAMDQSIRSVEALKSQPELQVELLGRLGAVYRAMGDSPKAQALIQNQWGLDKELYGENDERTLSAQMELAKVTSDAGGKRESLRIYEDLIQRWQSKDESGIAMHREVIQAYARELTRQGQGDKAMEIMKLALKPDRDGSIDVPSLRFQSDIQSSLGRYREAEASLTLALEQLEQRPGNRHIRRGSLLQLLSRAVAKQGKWQQAIDHLSESIRCEIEGRGNNHHKLIARHVEIARLQAKLKRDEEALRSVDSAIRIARSTGSEDRLSKAFRAAGEIREELGYLEAALAFRRECMNLERKTNTDRGKWLYELSQIIRLEDQLGLHADAEKDCQLLSQGIQSEPQIHHDKIFLKGLYQIMANACENWQVATGNKAHVSDIQTWHRLAAD